MSILDQIPYEEFCRLLEKTLKEDKGLHDMLAHVEREELFELVFEKLKAVSVDTRLVEETDPESGSTSFYIVTRKKTEVSWEEYDQVVHGILENICSDYSIVEDYKKPPS